MTIGERIKYLRKSKNMTQQELGDRIKITKASLSRIESGINNPSEQTVALICNELDVSEEWLRTGEGEMTPPVTRESEIAQITATLFRDEEESFRYRMIKALCAMDEDGWHYIEKLAEDIVNGKSAPPSNSDQN